MMLMLVAMASALGGCSLTMHLTSLKGDEEHTGAITPGITGLSSELDEEDWRRAQAALSLAVDPQGSGQPVNWDNPGTKRRGHFAPTGPVVLTETTMCRPFQSAVTDAKASETRQEGRACRTGPGEWVIREIRALGTPEAAPRAAREQALPPKSAPMLPVGMAAKTAPVDLSGKDATATGTLGAGATGTTAPTLRTAPPPL